MDWGAIFAFVFVIVFFVSYIMFSIHNYLVCNKLDKKIVEYKEQAVSRAKTMTDQEKFNLWSWQEKKRFISDKEIIMDLLKKELAEAFDEYVCIAGYYYGVHGGHRLDNYWFPYALAFSKKELLIYPIAEVRDQQKHVYVLGNLISVHWNTDEIKCRLSKNEIKLVDDEIGVPISVPLLYVWADLWPRYIDQRNEFQLLNAYLKNICELRKRRKKNE